LEFPELAVTRLLQQSLSKSKKSLCQDFLSLFHFSKLLFPFSLPTKIGRETDLSSDN
jgi:hypothetical protein